MNTGSSDADQPVRVAVVDDQALIRASLRQLIDAADGLDHVGEAGDGVAAVELADEARPDVMLMDIRMPRRDGINATRDILARAPRIAIVALTTFDGDEELFGALDAGVHGFLLKTAEPDTIIAAIRAAARGDAMLSPEVTRRVLAAAAARTTTPPAAPTPDRLSRRERELLQLLGEGLDNATIADRLHLSELTVKSYLTNLFTKLGVTNRLQAVVHAYNTGLLVPGGR